MTATVQRPGLVPTSVRPLTLHLLVESAVTLRETRDPASGARSATDATVRAPTDSRMRRTGVVTGGVVVVVVVVVVVSGT